MTERGTYFYPPTVLTKVPATAAILQEEIFGPGLDAYLKTRYTAISVGSSS